MNVVVIGCGAVLEYCHRYALQGLGAKLGCRVVGLVDPSPERLAGAKRWFPRARLFPNVETCYAALKDIQLSIITSPPALHAVHAEAAFRHGSHVLCEKPLASSLTQAQELTDAARRYGKVLAIGMTRRFYPWVAETRRRILGRALGERLSFEYREGAPYGWPVASRSPFLRQASGGGVLLDKGVHVLDCLTVLFGTGNVTAHLDDGSAEGVEANTVTRLEFERASGVVQLSWEMGLSNGLHIRGSEGEYWIPVDRLDLLFCRHSPDSPWQKEIVKFDWPCDLARNGRGRSPLDYSDCFNFQLVQTLRAIALGEAPAAGIEAGLASMRLLAAAYQMAKPLDKPWLSPAERAWNAAHHWRNA